MTVVYDASNRAWPQASNSALCLEDRFEILKEIGDGSFGSVALARVRSAGAQVARRGTLVRSFPWKLVVPKANGI
jgi:meiosis induction protein kinase IME2/SME1